MFIANLKEFLQIQRKVSITGNSHLSGKDAKAGVGNLFLDWGRICDLEATGGPEHGHNLLQSRAGAADRNTMLVTDASRGPDPGRGP